MRIYTFSRQNPVARNSSWAPKGCALIKIDFTKLLSEASKSGESGLISQLIVVKPQPLQSEKPQPGLLGAPGQTQDYGNRNLHVPDSRARTQAGLIPMPENKTGTIFPM